MFDFIKSKLQKFNIDLVSCLRLDECEINRAYLLERCGITDGSVIIFAVPYLTEASEGERNISSYAVSKDYHHFFKLLFDSVIEEVKNEYPQFVFAAFSDHSPINEIDAAVKSGLGIQGKNHLLITEKYSSYVFLGEIITNAILPTHATQKRYCENCGLCERLCPIKMGNSNECLSAITQKKGDLSLDEISAIKASGCAWGCDICQQVCPHTKLALKNKTIYSKIDYFYDSPTPLLKSDEIDAITKEDFSLRAYSWRGKSVIIRNLKILEKEEN